MNSIGARGDFQDAFIPPFVKGGMNGNTQTLATRLREEPSCILSGLELPDKVRNGLVSPQAVVKGWPSCTMERSISLWR